LWKKVLAREATFALKAISGFRSEVVETFGLLGCYAAQVGNLVIGYRSFGTTYRPASSAEVKQFKKNIRPVTTAALRPPLKETLCSWRKILKLMGNIEMCYYDMNGL
jgi:hypothetical protein